MIVGFFLVKTNLIEKLEILEIIGWTTINIWYFTLYK